VLYVLDEPSIGLHQRDHHRLIEPLIRLRDLGNTLIVVEHDEDTIKVADWVVDIGPGAGEHGGQVVVSGTVDDLLKKEDSLTGQYLSGKKRIDIPAVRRPPTKDRSITVVGARANNLKNVTVEFPLGCFVAVTGVSGSGKSTLVNDILSTVLANRINGGQGLAAGAMTGLGFMTKVFPAILGPVGLKFLPQRREKVALTVGAVLVALLIAAPFLALSPTYFVASYRAVFARSSWETVWALIDGYFSWGRVAPLGVRFDPTTAEYIAYRSRVPTLPIAIGFAILYAILWFRPVARTPRNMALFTAISTVGFLLYSKGYSPQFIIYVLPFVVVLLPWRRALGYSLALSAVNLLEWPIYHEWFGNVSWLLAIAVVARTLLWIALLWEWLAELWGWENRLAAIRLDRRVALAGAVAALLVAVPAGVVAWRTWTNAYYNGSPLRPAYDFVRRYDPAPVDEAALVFADQELYQQFHPYFWRDSDLYLFRPSTASGETIKHPSLTPEGRRETMTEIAREHRLVILIRKADDWTSRDLNDWLGSNMNLIAAARIGNADLSVWQVRDPGRAPRP
jgi:energy-coupling factor transporter ATP-binding protein EcfA2